MVSIKCDRVFRNICAKTISMLQDVIIAIWYMTRYYRLSQLFTSNNVQMDSARMAASFKHGIEFHTWRMQNYLKTIKCLTFSYSSSIIDHITIFLAIVYGAGCSRWRETGIPDHGSCMMGFRSRIEMALFTFFRFVQSGSRAKMGRGLNSALKWPPTHVGVSTIGCSLNRVVDMRLISHMHI